MRQSISSETSKSAPRRARNRVSARRTDRAVPFPGTWLSCYVGRIARAPKGVACKCRAYLTARVALSARTRRFIPERVIVGAGRHCQRQGHRRPTATHFRANVLEPIRRAAASSSGLACDREPATSAPRTRRTRRRFWPRPAMPRRSRTRTGAAISCLSDLAPLPLPGAGWDRESIHFPMATTCSAQLPARSCVRPCLERPAYNEKSACPAVLTRD